MNSPVLLGHRGARALKSIPENSIASFDGALADGCDGFEFDVRLSADRKGIVWHDPKFRKLQIGQATARQLPEVAQLEDVLARYQDRAFLDIELKVAGAEQLTVSLLKQFPPRHGYVVSSFLSEVLQRIHAIDAGIVLGLIAEKKTQLQPWTHLPVQYVIPHHRLVTPRFVRTLHEAGKRILVWTVNTTADMKRLTAYGVDGIISDKTSLLVRTLCK